MKHFEKQIENIKMNCEQEIEDLKDSALVEFTRQLKSSGKLKLLEEAQSKLESSKDLTSVKGDDYCHQYIRFNFSDIIDIYSALEKELLSRFLEENDFFMIPDFQNAILTYSIGPAICIGSDDGVVWDQDSNKVILKKHDYETVEERNEKIEEYMENFGWYPSVIELDRYGFPMYYVNTKKET